MLVSPIKDKDWVSVRQAIAKSQQDYNSSPTYVGLTLTGLTASRLISTDASSTLTSVSDLTSWVAGTSNQVTVTDDTDGTITLAAPQDLHDGASPTFSGILPQTADAQDLGSYTAGGGGGSPIGLLLSLTTSGSLVDNRWRHLYLSGNLSDGTDTVTVANCKTAFDHVTENGSSHTYIDQSVTTTASPTFAGLSVNGVSELGDGGTTNYVSISATGDVLFKGSSGLAFAEIYANDASNTITISSSGQANKVQVTTFDTNGVSNNMTPDHTNDHITVDNAGMYLCTVSIAAESDTGTGFEAGFSVYKNNGATEFANLHGHRNFSGGGGDEGSITLSGIIDLAVNDTIELWTWNETNTTNIIIDDVTLSLIQIGGT